jgi:putative DNA modification/repair radical SAM protein
MDFYKRNYIEGLFLSSGVAKSADETMEEMILVAKKLRVDHRFGGYIHLKAVAGCSAELLRKAGLYADRLSANIELPTQADLNSLAPAKSHAETEESMSHIRLSILESQEERLKSRKAPVYAPGGQSTQMIVGATPTNDRDIMLKASQLYTQQNLKRVYYSAFSPIPDSDPNLPPKSPPLIREHRLYQTDWLIRLYGFDIQEILPTDQPTLELDKDPKLAWALRNRAFFPVDINTAPREILLRVPGLGATLVERIISSRRHRMIRFSDIANLPSMKKAKFFITTVDNLFDAKAIDSLGLEATILKKNDQQLDLFTYSMATA